MRHGLLVAFAAIVLAGCSSLSEFSSDVPAYANIDDDSKPIATYVVANVSYHLLYFIPFSTGVTWKGTDTISRHNVSNFEMFADKATLDENLASVRAATRLAGSNRVANLMTTIEETSAWSLFIMRRRLIKTTCLILEPKE